MTRQIGALPYRIAHDGAAEVMLITSRDTGRWVVPKGHMERGLAPHEAAAQEAWEEAGLHGFACAAALGEYPYAKRRRRGAPVDTIVSLYPFAVTGQARDWPERRQRRTRWFPLAEAADAVAERELSALIAGFRPPPAPSGVIERMTPVIRTGIRRRFPMLGWFQSLMPQQGRFFDLFESHATTLVAGADALARLMQDGGPADGMEAGIARIVALEHQADDITRDVLQDVRRVFVTPFDRSAIIELIGVMDDAIDQMNQTAKSIALYGFADFDPRMRDMAGIIIEAARITAEAMPLLRSVNRNGDRLNELTTRLIAIEGQADDIHETGLRELFARCSGQPMDFIVSREIYSHLERVVDRFEDVANEIQGLVIDHA